MTLWTATAKDIGFSAHHQDTPRYLNPYEPGTSDAELWLQGWDKAEETARHIEVSEMIFPNTKGECEGCGTDQYTMIELNRRPDQINMCYACLSAKRYQKTLDR